MCKENQIDFESIDIRKNVSDFACIIEEGCEAKVDDIIKKIESKTSMEIAVVTINSLQGRTIDELAFKLFNKFGIGKKEENNGILLLISKDESQFRIEIGQGLEDIIDENTRKKLTEEIIIPNFKKGIYAPAILKFVKLIAEKVKRSIFSILSNVSISLGIIAISLAILGLILTAVEAFKVYLNIGEPFLTEFFILITIPAVVAAVAAVTCGIIDIAIVNSRDIKTRKISRSITGIVLGIISIAVIILTLIYLQPILNFLARLFSLSSGSY
jgi:uncharacterized membrane protein YgcG